MTLLDLYRLYERYVPRESRHPATHGLFNPDEWWPAHELGHLLTVPRRAIGLPMFGLDDEHPWVGKRGAAAYELAAMSVSRRLLVAACARELYFGENGELAYSNDDVFEHSACAGQILRRAGAHRLARTRDGLERQIQRRIGA